MPKKLKDIEPDIPLEDFPPLELSEDDLLEAELPVQVSEEPSSGPSEIENLRIPPTATLVDIEETFGEALQDIEALKEKVRTLLVPMAILTYKDLMSSKDPKMRKSAADAVMEIADLKGSSGSRGGRSGESKSINFFNLPPEESKILLGSLGKVFASSVDGEE